MYVPKLKAWKLKDENLKQEFADKLKLQNSISSTNDGVDEKWQRMRYPTNHGPGYLRH